ncbi:MAG: ABC transporter ATP-binding protein [Verrucomicrobiota bacterium]
MINAKNHKKLRKLRIKEICKFTLHNVSLEVREREIVTLLGASGSGKSTLLRIIAGVTEPDRGSVFIDEESVVDENIFVLPEKRQVGLVFQDYCLFPHMTVEENICFGLNNKMNKDTGDRKEILEELLIRFDMINLGKRYPHQISGGQQQRVAIARALACRPSLLLLDEPFSNLDEHLRETVRIEIQSILKQYDMTAIIVTHDKKDALSLSDRVALLKDGAIEQFDTPEAIYTCPQSTYVAQYFGRTNIIQATARVGGFETELGFFSHPHKEAMNQQGLLSIRPHWCQLCSKEQPLFFGHVKRIIEYGECQEVTIEPSSRPNKEFYIHLHRHEKVRSGQELGIDITAPPLKFIGKNTQDSHG